MTWRTWRAVTTLIAAILGWLTTAMPADITVFTDSGRDILTGHWGEVYAGTDNQAGPLQCVLSFAVSTGGRAATLSHWVTAAGAAALMLSAVTLAASLRRHETVGLGAALAAGYVLLWLSTGTFWDGHPFEVLIPVLWLLAARDSRTDGHAVRGALFLAASASIAPWGALGLPCLIRRSRARRTLVSLGVACVLSAAAYVPFLVLTTGGATRHRWPIDSSSLVHLVLPAAQSVGWGFRVGQAIAIVLVGACVQWCTAGRRHQAAAVVATITLLRIVTDPVELDYYWVPVAVAVTVLLAAIASRVATAQVACLAYAAWACSLAGLGALGAAVCLGLLLLVIADPAVARRHLTRKARNWLRSGTRASAPNLRA